MNVQAVQSFDAHISLLEMTDDPEQAAELPYRRTRYSG
jgi:hypothetical protein